MNTFFKACLIIVISSCATLGVLEGVIRIVVGAPWPEKLPLVRVRPDPRMGWVMIPGDVHYTYRHRVKLNSLGFRGREISTKGPNEYRILALGDSHVYGQGVSDALLLTSGLEAQLNAEVRGCSFQVINMGVRAYSVNQEAALLEERGVSLDPDHVLLFFYINDIAVIDIGAVYARFRDLEWYTFDVHGQMSGKRLYLWKVIQGLRRSALLMWVHDQYRDWRSRGNAEELILRGVTTGDLEAQVAMVERTLDKMASMAKNHGAAFTLIAIPVASQVVHEFKDELYQSWLKRYADSRGIPFVDLLPGLRAYYWDNQRVPVIPFDGHYDSDGHSVMAAAVHSYLSPTAKTWCERRS